MKCLWHALWHGLWQITWLLSLKNNPQNIIKQQFNYFWKQKKTLITLSASENQQKRTSNLKSSLDTAVSLHFHCSPGRQHIGWPQCLVVLRVTPHGCRLQVTSFSFFESFSWGKTFYSLIAFTTWYTRVDLINNLPHTIWIIWISFRVH